MKTNWKPLVDERLQEYLYASHNDGDIKTFFMRTGDNAWTCTHGGWTLYVDKFFKANEDMLRYYPHLKGYGLDEFYTSLGEEFIREN